jgi:hypothetical protein
MSLPPIPTKTALGQEEMRRRTGGLGQRHRTILFLIDGRRPLSEVLSLAQKAGAATHHFEDLVRMGFVELPAEEPPAPAPEAPELPAQAEITELALEVTPEAQAEAVDAETAAAPDVPDVPDVGDAADTGDRPPVASPAPFAAVVPLPRAVPPPPAAVVPLVRAVPLPPPPPAPVAAPPAARMEMPASLNFDAVASLPDRPFLPPSRTAPPPPPAAPLDDQPVLEQARAQLQETLRCDPQPASARLAERVRLAQGASELIEVVWTMERGLHHYQRSHRGLVALQRARELLGLGNTLVDEDSQPSRLEDDDW